jgi:DNA polymerase III epsilon subunit-like protein
MVIFVCYYTSMSKKQKFLVVDTETGGLDCDDHSLLSVAGISWEPNGEVTPVFDLYIKEDEINAIDKALKINKIDLNEVNDKGFSPKMAVASIRGHLDAHFGLKRRPIQLVAHNAPFDLGFLKRLYRLAEEDFKADFRDRALDTCSILQFLMLSGKVEGFRASADTLFKAAGVTIAEEDRHTAFGDAMATAQSLNVILNKF